MVVGVLYLIVSFTEQYQAAVAEDSTGVTEQSDKTEAWMCRTRTKSKARTRTMRPRSLPAEMTDVEQARV